MTISKATPPNAPRASGRKKLLGGVGTSCVFADEADSGSWVAGGAGASQGVAPSGSDDNSTGRPRAAQKS
jgi:hypothetical protein